MMLLTTMRAASSRTDPIDIVPSESRAEPILIPPQVVIDPSTASPLSNVASADGMIMHLSLTLIIPVATRSPISFLFVVLYIQHARVIY
jgi:hypothetical protein